MAGERILVVDDEPGVRSALEAILGDEGLQVTCTDSGEGALDAVGSEKFDAILLDIWLPGIDGLDTLQRVRDQDSGVQVVMISGHGNIETAVRATKLGAFDFIEKPLSLEKTLLVLRNALRQGRLERMNRHLLAQLARDTEIVGTSAAAVRLRSAVEAALRSRAPVLLCGEAGSGRQTIARRIHSAASEPDTPFVDVPCGALDRKAAELALYGESERPGRLQLAAGGDLFLEDVERLSPTLQRRLAATLAGGYPDGPVFRVMASTAPEPRRLTPELLQRLDVIRIDVPALRERREDVPQLAERFMLELSREYGQPPKRWTPKCLDVLTAHDWPGNIRELSNLVERLLLFTSGEKLEPSDLPADLGGARRPAEDLYSEFSSLEDGLRAFERYYIAKILAKEEGRVNEAAARLGISPATLKRRMKNL